MSSQHNPASYLIKVDEERKHLEGLFKDRINFHIVFATLFMAGLSTIDNLGIRVAALATITLVSSLMALAILRSYCLVRLALNDIKKDLAHPYTIYQAKVWLPNANNSLIPVPFILTLFFFLVTLFYGYKWCMHDQASKPSCTIYQTEDHSDRRVMSGSPAQ